MFGFTFTRTKKTPVVVTPVVPVAKENVKLQEGATFIHTQHLVQALQGQRKLTMPVGREVDSMGVWKTLFIRTRRDGSIIIDKHGNVILNRR